MIPNVRSSTVLEEAFHDASTECNHVILLQCDWEEADGEMPKSAPGEPGPGEADISGQSGSAGGRDCSAEEAQSGNQRDARR